MKAEGVAGVVAPSSYVVGFAVLEWGWRIVRGWCGRLTKQFLAPLATLPLPLPADICFLNRCGVEGSGRRRR